MWRRASCRVSLRGVTKAMKTSSHAETRTLSSVEPRYSLTTSTTPNITHSAALLGSKSHFACAETSRSFSAVPLSASRPSGDKTRVKEFRLAQTGEGIKECELLRWFVKEGDPIEEYGAICEVQSDKATIELTSPFAGTVARLLHTPGATVAVGEVLAEIMALPSNEDGLGFDVMTAAAAPPSTQKLSSTVDRPSPSQTSKKNTNNTNINATDTKSNTKPDVKASPATRRMARELNIDLGLVVGTGPGGRITRDDVEAAVVREMHGIPAERGAEDDVAEALSASGAAAFAVTTSLAEENGTSTSSMRMPLSTASTSVDQFVQSQSQSQQQSEPVVVPLRGYRRAMARSMAAAAAIPHFHFCDEIDVGQLVQIRARLRGSPSLGAAHLTLLPFFIKAAALALADFPALNSSLSLDGESLIVHPRANIGIAVATPHGLVVPCVSDAGGMSVAEIASEVARLQAAAAANQLRPEDLAGGTFTVSNVGTIGGTYATPLCSPPQSAIMALGRMQRLPRFSSPDSTAVVAAHIINVSLGADHRVVDGAALAGFSGAVKSLIENPEQFLLRCR